MGVILLSFPPSSLGLSELRWHLPVLPSLFHSVLEVSLVLDMVASGSVPHPRWHSHTDHQLYFVFTAPGHPELSCACITEAPFVV